MNNNDFFRTLYNEHIEYKSLRKQDGPEYEKYIDDVKYWKIKYLEKVIFNKLQIENINSILEIGCATGVLLDTIFANSPVDKTGIDISEENILFGIAQRPHINFISGTFEEYLDQNNGKNFDLIILSDILEHVQEDVQLLNLAGRYSDYVLLNLPIEKVKEYEGRNYGVDDPEGHLRAYSTEDVIELCNMANMEVIYSLERHYVLEPVFKKYLLGKIVKKNTSKVDALLEYSKEIIDIELNKEIYKRNFFALLRVQNERTS